MDKSSQTLKSLASATLPDAGVALATHSRSIYVAIDSGIKTFLCKSAGLTPLSRFHHDVRVSATIEQTAVDISADGKTLVLAADDGSVVVLSMPRYKILFKGALHSDGITDLNLSNDGRLACTTAHDRQALVWDTRSGSIVQSIAPASTISSKSDSVNPTPGQRPPPRSHVRALRLSARGTLLYAAESGHNGGFVSVWRATGSAPAFATTAVVRITSEAVTGLAVNECGTMAAVATSEGHICILRYNCHANLSIHWKTDYSLFNRGVPPHVLPITGMCFVQDETHLVTASADRSVALWDFERQPSRRPLIWLAITMLIAVFVLCAIWLLPSIALSKRRSSDEHPSKTQTPAMKIWKEMPQCLPQWGEAWNLLRRNPHEGVCSISEEALKEQTSYGAPQPALVSEQASVGFETITPGKPGEEGEPGVSAPQRQRNRRRSRSSGGASSSPSRDYSTKSTESAKPHASESNLHGSPVYSASTGAGKKKHDKQATNHGLTREEPTLISRQPDVLDYNTDSPGDPRYTRGLEPSHDTHHSMPQGQHQPQGESPSSTVLNNFDATTNNDESTRHRKGDSDISQRVSKADKENGSDDRNIVDKSGYSHSQHNLANYPEAASIGSGKRRKREKRVSSSSGVDHTINTNSPHGNVIDKGDSVLHEASGVYKNGKQSTLHKGAVLEPSYHETNFDTGQTRPESTRLKSGARQHKTRNIEEANEAYVDASVPNPSSSVSTVPTTSLELRVDGSARKTSLKATNSRLLQKSSSNSPAFRVAPSAETRYSPATRSTDAGNSDSLNYHKNGPGGLSPGSQFCMKLPYPPFVEPRQQTPYLDNRLRYNTRMVENMFPSSTSRPLSANARSPKGRDGLEIAQSSQGSTSPRVKLSRSQTDFRGTAKPDSKQEIQNAVDDMLASLGSDTPIDINNDETGDPNKSHVQPSGKVIAPGATAEVTAWSVARKLLLVRFGIFKKNRCLKHNLVLHGNRRTKQYEKQAPALGLGSDERLSPIHALRDTRGDEHAAGSVRIMDDNHVGKTTKNGIADSAGLSLMHSYSPRAGVCNRHPPFIATLAKTREYTVVQGQPADKVPEPASLNNASELETTKDHNDDDSEGTVKREDVSQRVSNTFAEDETAREGKRERRRHRRRRKAGMRF